MLLAWKVYGERIRNKFMSGRQVGIMFDTIQDHVCKNIITDEV